MRTREALLKEPKGKLVEAILQLEDHAKQLAEQSVEDIKAVAAGASPAVASLLAAAEKAKKDAATLAERAQQKLALAEEITSNFNKTVAALAEEEVRRIAAERAIVDTITKLMKMYNDKQKMAYREEAASQGIGLAIAELRDVAKALDKPRRKGGGRGKTQSVA